MRTVKKLGDELLHLHWCTEYLDGRLLAHNTSLLYQLWCSIRRARCSDSVNNVMREFGPPCRLMWERRGARSLISRHRQPLYRMILCAATTGCHTIKYRPPAPRSQASISLLNTDSVLTMWSTPRIIMSKYHEPFALRWARITRPFQRFGFRDLFFSKHRLSSFSFNRTVESWVPVAISNHTPIQL